MAVTSGDTKKVNHPLLQANCISRIFFCWLNAILRKGSQKTLEFDDVFDVLDEDKSSRLCSLVERHWEAQISNQNKSHPSLAKALFKSFGPSMLMWCSIYIFEEAAKIIQPLLIGGLIKYFTQEKNDIAIASWYALGICLCAVVPALIHHTFFVAVFRIGMKMRVSCCALIYRKLARLSISSLDKTAEGQMINLMSNDVLRFDFAVALCPYLLLGPLELIIVTIILWFYIGWAAIAGMFTVLIIFPITGLTAKLFSRLRSQITQLTDKRLSLMNEILRGIQLIKMSCWEVMFEDAVMATRAEEVKRLMRAGYARAGAISPIFYSGKLIMLFTFLTYVLLGNKMTAEAVFVSMCLYNPIRFSMTLSFPMAMQFGAETLVTIRRLQEFLLLEEKGIYLKNCQETSGSPKVTIKASDLSISWGLNKPVVLRNVNFEIKENDLLMVVGSVGSGKTSLLLAILKELPLAKGTLNAEGEMAYVPQLAWTFNASVRKNIVMGSKFDEHRYNKVIDVASLLPDLKQMPKGDETNVGDRGLNLSGGQKARVGLARALYRDADIYLFDDPLSAVDANVSQLIFNKCIKEYLSNKLRVLVTHQLQYLHQATKILVLNKNGVHICGDLKYLVAMGVDVVKIIKESKDTASPRTSLRQSDDFFSMLNSSKVLSKSMGYTAKDHILEDSDLRERFLSRSSENVKKAIKNSTTSLDVFAAADFSGSTFQLRRSEFEGNDRSEEEVMVGSKVPMKLYKKYLTSGGGDCTFLIFVLLNFLAQTSFLVADWWLAFWCVAVEKFDNSLKNSNTTYSTTDDASHSNVTRAAYDVTTTPPPRVAADLNFPHTSFYLIVFSILATMCVFLGIVRAMYFFYLAIKSSHNLHKEMLSAVIRYPSSFFSSNPTGRILNRFSKDLGQVDESLPLFMYDLIQCIFLVLGVFVIISIMNPWVILGIVPVMICFVLMRNYFLKTMRNVKKLEAISKGPMFSHVNSTFHGLQVIRCHHSERFFVEAFDEFQDNNTAVFSLFLFLGRWFAVRLEWLCAILSCIVTFCTLIPQSYLSGSSVGLSLCYVMTLLWLFQWVVRQSTEVEGMMTSVERIVEYSEMPVENVSTSSRANVLLSWPQKGKISFRDVSLRYKTSGPCVLNHLTLDINPGEKIGIVGRTGAGKSSLINLLFRMFDFEGQLLIDDVDICSIGLNELRRKLSIIPQEPLLHSGTLRKNLDPLCDHSNAMLWNALKKVEMYEMVEGMENGLDSIVSDGGSNMSLGQKQLLCMARALLRNNKILIIDEATANVDRQTDSFIQKTLREEFAECTVMTIAHRLNTVIDYDKIMVLESGSLVDFGAPYTLLQNKESALYNLAQKTGREEFASLFKTAKNSFDAKRTVQN